MEEVLFQTRFFSAIKTENDSNHSSDPNKRIHSLMSEEHLIASTVKTLCRGMRYPNCDMRALFMISINFH